MTTFIQFRDAVNAKFNEIAKGDLYRTDISKDEIWETYLGSFTPELNPQYKERTEHDCNCCKQFIRGIGRAVAIVEGNLVSVWDIEIEGDYQLVADAMSAAVKSKAIDNIFLTTEPTFGQMQNYQHTDEDVLTWNHFHAKVPSRFVNTSGVATQMGDAQANLAVLKRSLQEITLEAADTVLELINQKSLYRGEEHKRTVTSFIKLKREVMDIISPKTANLFLWENASKLGAAGRFRNTVIGTLMTDISEGKPLDVAVASFESKVAPMNYKRTSALITPRMVKAAQEKVEELGIADALPRRNAVAEDLTINNVIFADRSAKQAMNPFDELMAESQTAPKKLKKVDTIDAQSFMTDVVPNAETIELLVENSFESRMMSLVAPVHADAPSILKWDNNFTWTYNGDVTDSIKERVKQAGGAVDGYLRASLSWFNYDDLDIQMRTPSGMINFSNKRAGGGQLDVDMNVDSNGSRQAVENITWPTKATLKDGDYEIRVNNYCKRENKDVGFVVELEVNGDIMTFEHNKGLRNNETVSVVSFRVTKGEVRIGKSLPSSAATREVWGVKTNQFQKVSMVMNSPNHWDGQEIGNKHLFFILEGCYNSETTRGFYNEYLRNELTEHRKVFEMLGDKMKVASSQEQLSGVGFSSTQRAEATFRVTGKTTRTIKVQF